MTNMSSIKIEKLAGLLTLAAICFMWSIDSFSKHDTQHTFQCLFPSVSSALCTHSHKGKAGDGSTMAASSATWPRDLLKMNLDGEELQAFSSMSMGDGR